MNVSRQRSGEYMNADMGGRRNEAGKPLKRSSGRDLVARPTDGEFLPQMRCNQVSRRADLPAWSSSQSRQEVPGGRRMNHLDKHSSNFGSRWHAPAFFGYFWPDSSPGSPPVSKHLCRGEAPLIL